MCLDEIKHAPGKDYFIIMVYNIILFFCWAKTGPMPLLVQYVTEGIFGTDDILYRISLNERISEQNCIGIFLVIFHKVYNVISFWNVQVLKKESMVLNPLFVLCLFFAGLSGVLSKVLFCDLEILLP